MNRTLTQLAIDRRIEEAQNDDFRMHLGASIIGRECAREIWYSFHWAKKVRHKARQLRLFDRGNLEEERFVNWLRAAGVFVEDRNVATGKQHQISDHGGHFGGSKDAHLRYVPDWPTDEWLLGEFKTHNEKSFKELVKLGVKKAKFEHYVQMQVYMLKSGMPAALYMAINKNDDDMYVELVEFDIVVATMYLDRAGQIIAAREPPARISENPGWYKCQWCDFLAICHSGKPMAHNCRTCVNAVPVDGGWHCTRYNYPLNETDQKRGCTTHTPY
jgi:hypothetical protein